MPQSQARVESARAGRYLGQLCKHFAHKLPVEHTEAQGRIEFPIGVCTLAAEPGVLVLNARSDSDETLVQLEGVIARHLERFAFRDTPAIDWRKLA
jgi:uncharacterized protein